MRRAAAALAALGAVAAAGLLPTAAEAHSIVRVSGGETAYLSSDAVSLNTLDVTLRGQQIRLYDPTVDGGIDPGSSNCLPGETNARSEVVEVLCPRDTSRVRIELGEREDKLTSTVGVPILALGGGGRDELTTGAPADIVVGNEGNDVIATGEGNDQANGGDGDDVLRGGGGADVLQAGLGADEIDGGAGDDDIRARDGAPDRVVCGDGADKVDADTVDDVAGDCEAVARAAGAPPPQATGDAGGGGADTGSGGSSGSADQPAAPGGSGGGAQDAPSGGLRADETAPRLEVGGYTSQRVGRSGRLRLLATSSERGTIAASGALEVAGLALPLKTKVERVASAGGGVVLAIRLSKGQLRRVRRALRTRRRVSVRLGVVATDLAGNSTEAKAPVVRLRR